MNKHFVALIGIAIFGFSSAGSAAIYDFAAQGNSTEAGYSSFNTGTNPDSILPPGIVITASNGGGLASVPFSPTPSSTEDYFAYFDGKTSADGGLGVCRRDQGDCAGNPDDNQMPREYIHMDFDNKITIDTLSITGDHAPVIDRARFWYSLDEGVNWLFYDFGSSNPLVEVLALNVMTSTLDYTIQDMITEDDKTAYMYLSAMTTSAVPVPAAFWLFGTALLGFISFSRRTRV